MPITTVSGSYGALTLDSSGIVTNREGHLSYEGHESHNGYPYVMMVDIHECMEFWKRVADHMRRTGAGTPATSLAPPNTIWPDHDFTHTDILDVCFWNDKGEYEECEWDHRIEVLVNAYDWPREEAERYVEAERLRTSEQRLGGAQPGNTNGEPGEVEAT